MHYDSDFHRMRQDERMEEIRAEYRRAQRWMEPGVSVGVRRYARSAWAHMRHPVARRAPAYRA